LPRDFAREFPETHGATVPQAGCAGIQNGQLLRLIAQSGKFDLFLTVDKNLPQQQRIDSLPFAVVVLRPKSNRSVNVKPFAVELPETDVEFQTRHGVFSEPMTPCAFAKD